jgi:hypothetical protein
MSWVQIALSIYLRTFDNEWLDALSCVLDAVGTHPKPANSANRAGMRAYWEWDDRRLGRFGNGRVLHLQLQITKPASGNPQVHSWDNVAVCLIEIAHRPQYYCGNIIVEESQVDKPYIRYVQTISV